MRDFAKGIPDSNNTGDLANLKAGDFVDLVVQKHLADRAGAHLDYRFGNKKTGLFSWATKKELPSPGERRALFQQPLHDYDYKDFEGDIPKGQYGAGHVTKHEDGQLLITKVSPRAIQFTKAHKRFPEKFVLVKPKEKDGKQWLLINTTPIDPIPYQKVHYSKVSPDNAEKVLSGLQPGSSVQAKIDGAASLTKIMRDNLEVVSYRASKQTGGPIVHTDRIFKGKMPPVKVPTKYIGSVLRGELFGTKNGKSIRPQELGGLLNSSVLKSVKDQEERHIDLKNMIFDIQQEGKVPVKNVPYEKRLKLVKEIMKYLPEKHFQMPEEATTPEEAVKLYNRIKSGKNPLTREGIVIHTPHEKPTKIKFTEDHDVYITNVFPGKKRLTGIGSGGFAYSLTPDGPTVGEVGSGFSDKLRRDMHKNPSDYIGRVAKIRAQEQLPSGAFRGPSLLALHEDI